MWFLWRVLAVFTVFLILTSALLLFAIPKFPVIDNLLMRRGVFLVFEEVKENIFSVELRNVEVLVRGEELLRFERLEFGVSPQGPYSRGRCGGGFIHLAVSWGGSVRLSSEGFTCVRGASSFEADLKVDGGLWGSLKVEGLEVEGTELEVLELTFEGERFTGRAVLGGRELKGRGKFKLKTSDLGSSYVDGVFRGEGIAVRVVGKLESISVQVLY